MIFLASFVPNLTESGPDTKTGDSKRRHVNESMGLSSQTGPPDPQTDPPDPPGGSPGEFWKNLYCFFKLACRPREVKVEVTYSPSPSAASRQRETARNHLKSSLERGYKKRLPVRKNIHLQVLAGHLIDHPLDAIRGWDPRSGSVGLADTNREF